MLETIWKLCQVLSTDPVSPQDVALSLGTTLPESAGGQNAPILLKPDDRAFKEAMIVREIGQNTPAHVELTLAQPGKLTLNALSDRFGHYSVAPRLHPSSPLKALFYIDISGQPRTCAIIAQTAQGIQGADMGLLEAVTVRRDIRLP